MRSTTADDALALIEAGLGALAAAGSEAADQGRLDKVRRLVAGSDRMTAILAAAVREAEVHQAAESDGLTSIKAWLRTHERLSGAAINGLVREARDRRAARCGGSIPRPAANAHAPSGMPMPSCRSAPSCWPPGRHRC